MKMWRCKFPNCGELLGSAGFCAAHAEYGRRLEEERKRRAFADASRANEPLYRTARWRNLRKAAIARNKKCSVCGKTGELTVHHIVPPRGNIALFFCAENLAVICRDCHRTETAREIRERFSEPVGRPAEKSG